MAIFSFKQAIQQRGLPHVRPSDDRDRAELHGSDSLLGAVGNQLIHRFTLPNIAKPFPRQLFDPGRIMLQTIDFSTQDGRGPLQILNVPSKLLGMVAHGEIAWKPHFAKEQGQQQQQAHAGADILCTGHPAPLPIQPLPPAITFNDHTNRYLIRLEAVEKGVSFTRPSSAIFFTCPTHRYFAIDSPGHATPRSSLASTRHRLPTPIHGGTSQLFLDPEQLIVLGHTIRPGQ